MRRNGDVEFIRVLNEEHGVLAVAEAPVAGRPVAVPAAR
jgi:hypothetical protein